MIDQIARSLQTALTAKGCPVKVYTRDVLPTATFGRERIVVDRDRDEATSFGPVKSQHRNPKYLATETEPCVLRITAQSPKSGATLYDHEERARKELLPVVLTCLRIVMAGASWNGCWTLKTRQFIRPEDLKDSERPGGAVLEVKFAYEQGVPEMLSYAVAAKPEITFGADGHGIDNTTKISGANFPDNDSDPNNVPAAAESACTGGT